MNKDRLYLTTEAQRTQSKKVAVKKVAVNQLIYLKKYTISYCDEIRIN